jgi:hypothetical protein
MRNLWDLDGGKSGQDAPDQTRRVQDDARRTNADAIVNWKGCKVCRKPHPQDPMKRVWPGKRVWIEDGMFRETVCECSKGNG